MKNSNQLLFKDKCFSTKSIVAIVICIFCTPSVFAMATFTAGSTDAQLLTQLQGPGVTLSNATLIAGNRPTQVGVFSNGIAGANFQFDTGIAFSTGSMTQAFQVNTFNTASINAPGPLNFSDPDLIAIDPIANFDTVVFAFDTILDAGFTEIQVAYQFASDEYPDSVGSRFNDIFGLFISGPGITGTQNIALVPGTTNAIRVNAVNAGFRGCDNTGFPVDLTQTALYNNNGHNGSIATCTTNPGPFIVTTEYNGITNALTATISGLSPGPGNIYRVKLAIADTGDSVYDSGVFINQVSASGSDFSDDPISYGTASHGLDNNLLIGTLVDPETAAIPTPNADGDTDEGVTFESFLDGSLTKFRIRANVTGQNDTGATAMLCGYLDGAANGSVNNSYQSAVDYTVGGNVGTGTITALTGNEEVCIQVPAASSAATDSTYTATVGFNGATGHCDSTAADGSFSCNLDFNPDFTSAGTTFARFRLTSDPAFFSTTSPSPTGSASNGEVESYKINFMPTLATIGTVNLSAISLKNLFAQLTIDKLSDAELLALLQAWDPEAATTLAGADRAELLNALKEYLDPDGDGKVAILRWDTLEERGTIGFYVDRRVGENAWQRINNDLLPGLISAPMGGEYLLADPTAHPTQANRYRLIELEATGTTRTYGPYLLKLQ